MISSQMRSGDTNHDGSTSGTHGFFTGVFFIGNAVVVPTFSKIAWPWFKYVLWVGIAVVAVLWRLEVISTFFAEWLAMGLISGHFILDQLPTKSYSAMKRGERPKISLRRGGPAPAAGAASGG